MKKIDRYILPMFLTCIVAVALRCLALLTAFDIDSPSMHFTDKTVITIASTVVVLSVIGFLAYLFVGEKDIKLIERNDNAASFIPAGIVCIAILFMGITNLKMYITGYPTGILAPATLKILSTLSLITAALAFLSVIAFFLSVFIERRDNLFKGAFGLCIVFFLAAYAAILYFNKHVHPTNSPNRFIDEMAYLSAAIFFLFEARIPLGRAIWRGYSAFGLVATLMCSYSAIPALVLYFAKGYVISESIIENLLTLTLAIYICSKVLQTKRLIPDEECDAAKAVAMLSSLREEMIRELHNPTHAQDINEMEENTPEADNFTIEIPEPIAPEESTDSQD